MGGAEQASRHGLRIFISYRREDTPGYAGRVYDYLVERFGQDRVFMDIDTIRPGSDFTEVITNALDECDVLLALIGRTWLTRTDGKGRRRLDDPDDLVRVELEAALRRSITIIPLLVQDAKMPAREELPGPLARIASRQAFEISDRRWRTDITALIDELERQGSEKAQQPEPHESGGHPSGMFGPFRLDRLLGASRRGSSTIERSALAARRRRGSVLVAVVAALALVLAVVGVRLLRPTELPGVDAGPASQTQLKFPYGVGLDAAGRIFIADSGNLRVRRVDGRTISTIAADGAVLIAAIENNNVRKVDPAGTISTLAGNGARGYSGDAVAPRRPSSTVPGMSTSVQTVRSTSRTPATTGFAGSTPLVGSAPSPEPGRLAQRATAARPPKPSSTHRTESTSTPTGSSTSPTSATTGSAGWTTVASSRPSRDTVPERDETRRNLVPVAPVGRCQPGRR